MLCYFTTVVFLVVTAAHRIRSTFSRPLPRRRWVQLGPLEFVIHAKSLSPTRLISYRNITPYTNADKTVVFCSMEGSGLLFPTSHDLKGNLNPDLDSYCGLFYAHPNPTITQHLKTYIRYYFKSDHLQSKFPQAILPIYTLS